VRTPAPTLVRTPARLMVSRAAAAHRIFFALALVADCVSAPKVTADIAASISDGRRIKDGTDVLDIVPLAALAVREHNFCSAASPCWMAAAGSLRSVLFASVTSNAILRRYSGGKSAGSCPPADGQRTLVQNELRSLRETSLITDSLLAIPPFTCSSA